MRRTPTGKPRSPLRVDALRHDDDKRRNIPTAEYQLVLEKQKLAPVEVRYPRGDAAQALEAENEARDRDLDPQRVWCASERR